MTSLTAKTRSVGGEPRFLAWLFLLTGVGAALRFLRLGSQSIWIDEGMSIGWIAEIERSGWGSLLQNIHGPLHAAALYLASRVSMSEWWLRAPSALAGTLAIPALATLGRRLCGDRVALTAAAVFALNPFALYYSQEVRSYAFTLVFASLTAAAAWSLARQPGWRRAARFAVFEILSVASNLNGVFYALGLNAWLVWVLRRQRRALLCWGAVHALVALPFLPYASQIVPQVRPERMVGVETGFGDKDPLRGRTTLHPMSLPYTAYAFAAGYSLGPTLEDLRRDPGTAVQVRHLPALVLVVAGFGVPLVACVAHVGAWRAGAALIAAALSTIGFTVWLAAGNLKPYNARYLSVLLPAYLLAVACGMWRLPQRPRGLVAVAVAAVSIWSCYNYLFVPRYARDDTRGVVQYLVEHAGPEDLVLHINLGFSLPYYDRLPQAVHLAAPGSGSSPQAARRYLDGILSGVPTLWYLECRPEKLDPRGYLRQACVERAVTSESQEFTGIRVHRFALHAANSESHQR